MLKSQEAASEQPPLSAGRARVTPEELTKALAAIETRKQAEASRLAGTIPLEDAVSELNLDSTPEEIWAEVQAQRIKAAPTAPSAPLPAMESESEKQERVRRSQSFQERGQGGLVVTPLRVQIPRGKRRWLRPFVPFLAIWALFATGVIPHGSHHSPLVSAPILRNLASIPDGKEVYADDTALIQVSEGKPLTQVTISENETGNRWRMVKISGHTYLRGYILNTEALSSISGKALDVYNDDNAGELHGERTSNITLRVDKVPLQKSGGDSDYSEVTLPNFQPDPLTTLSPWR